MATTKVIFVIIFGIILLILLTLILLQFGKIYEEEYGIEALFKKLQEAIENFLKNFIG
ncbi:MAG: hypothetical protein QW228_09570 [Candidatus Aenigmatarchaeota archaeon]